MKLYHDGSVKRKRFSHREEFVLLLAGQVSIIECPIEDREEALGLTTGSGACSPRAPRSIHRETQESGLRHDP